MAIKTETITRLSAPPILTGDQDQDCPSCQGTGTRMVAQRLKWGRGQKAECQVLEEIMISPDMAPMHYNDHWPWPVWQIGASVCDCQQPLIARRRMQAVLGQSSIPDDCYRFTFADFQVGHAGAMKWAMSFVDADSIVDGEGKERTGLLFSGTPGIGKTTLGSLVFRERVEKGQLGVWIKMIDLVAKVRATYKDGYEGPSVDEMRQTMQYAPFLMLDDLGSLTRGTTYAEDMIEFLFLVFDHRWAKRLPTLVTTNLLEPELVAQFGEPVVSRLYGLCHVVAMCGTDVRRAPVVQGWRGANDGERREE